MFTGLIGWVGRLESISTTGEQVRLRVDARGWGVEPATGDSIAVQGVCLTLVGSADGRLNFDVLRRTLEVTALSRKQPGAALNLEVALRMGDFLGGHFVSGHVDGVARVKNWRQDGSDRILTLAPASDLLAQIVPKASVAVDGVSLTVSDLSKDEFQVRIIPHTWKHTSLHELRAGDDANLETDMLGKYARSSGSADSANAKPLDMQRLIDAGFQP